MSDASLSILKKLSRIYPNNAEIAAEKILAIESYSLQQKINIFNCITVDVDLLSILKSLIGYTKVYIHKTEENEIKFDDLNSCYSIIFDAPVKFALIFPRSTLIFFEYASVLLVIRSIQEVVTSEPFFWPLHHVSVAQPDISFLAFEQLSLAFSPIFLFTSGIIAVAFVKLS